MATGENILQLAARHVGEPYILGALAPKNNANWRGPWDCAEFTSWCVFQVAGKLYGCDNNNGNPSRADAFTGFWSRDVNNLGIKISVEVAAKTPGAMVLRKPQPGLIGHIVVSDGRGGTVEAHSHATGVIKSTLANRRWDTGVLVPGIEYSQRGDTVIVTPPTLVFHLTNPLMRGKTVREPSLPSMPFK